MRRTIISIAAGLLIPVAAFANISDDIAAKKSAADIVANAQEQELTIEQIAQAVCTTDESLINEIVTAAVQAGFEAKSVMKAASACGQSEELIQMALLADPSLDPTELGEATAAGNPQGQGQGLLIAPGQTGQAVSPAPFISNAGGGGNPSPT